VTSIPELKNTVACEWHHSLTPAIASFRVAKGVEGKPTGHAMRSRRFGAQLGGIWDWSEQATDDCLGSWSRVSGSKRA